MRRPVAVLAVAIGLSVPAGTGPAPVAAQDPAPGPPPDAAPDSLLDHGRLQEAAWALRAAGDTARADTVLARLRSILTAWPRAAAPLSMDSQGVSYTWQLSHGQGVASIFKVDGSDIFCPECGADREVAAYRVDRLLGFDLTPMTVFTRITDQDGDTLSGSTQYYVAGTETARDLGFPKSDALRLFDAIIGNSDRHQGNWLVMGDRVAAIDHNRAFEYQPSTRPKTCWEAQVDSITEPGALGPPWRRYRSLSDDSIRSALAGVDSALVSRFITMREEVVARVEARAVDPDRKLPLDDCEFES